MPLLASWEIFRHQCTFRPQRRANLIAYISHFQSHQLAALLTLVVEEVVRRSSSLSMNQDHFISVLPTSSVSLHQIFAQR